MTNIIDLYTYKSNKGINSTTNDVKITSLVDSVNSFIVAYCNRTFIDSYSTDKVEYHDGTQKEVYPLEFPIRSVTSIAVTDDFGQTYTNLEEFVDYVTDYSNDKIIAIYDQFAYGVMPTRSLKLTYKAGYANVPLDLQLAAIHLIEYYMEEQYTPRKSLQGATIENLLYTDSSSRLPAHIKRTLDYYRAQVL